MLLRLKDHAPMLLYNIKHLNGQEERMLSHGNNQSCARLLYKGCNNNNQSCGYEQ